MNFKKRVNGLWTDTPNYIYNTSTDTITTLPTVVYSNDTTATVGLKGNMSQASGVSPDNPIQPQECGERTGNLFDKDRTAGVIDNAYINQSGETISSNNYYISYLIAVEVGTTYTWRFNEQSFLHTAPTVAFYDNNENLIGAATHSSSVKYFSFTIPSNCVYIRCSVYKRIDALKEAMLNSGSEPLPYEPYGYKIPISSANTTTNVYLGEVQSTRQIKKLVLTGEETWALTASGRFYRTISDKANIIPICTHFKGSNAQGYSSVPDGGVSMSISTYIVFYKSDITNVDDWKSFLTAQYAAGTPVTVWYVLATEETAVVNEPLRKIGDYADTISNVAEIPTTAGEQTFDVQTTLKPSSVEITYKGWHKHTPKEYDNGSWS